MSPTSSAMWFRPTSRGRAMTSMLLGQPGGLSPAHADAVTEQGRRATGNSFHRAQKRNEDRPPLVPVDVEAGASKGGGEGLGRPEPDVRRIRRVEREHPAGPKHAVSLSEHPLERPVVEVLDEVGGDRLFEGLVLEGEVGDVGNVELE